MSNKAPQINEMSVSEERIVSVSFSGKLSAGELLTGTPVVTDCDPQSPEHLTFSNQAVNVAALTINGESVPIGEAVQFKVTGVVANTKYTIKISCATTSTPAEALIGVITLRGIADC